MLVLMLLLHQYCCRCHRRCLPPHPIPLPLHRPPPLDCLPLTHALAPPAACLTTPHTDLSVFQRLVLGPDAHLVVGLPKLLVQVSPHLLLL